MFNSQLVTKPDGKMLFVTPIECQEHDAVRETLEAIVAADNPIDEIAYINVRQSMRNGGGPACLRLRVVLNDAELARLNASVLLTDSLYESLVAWVGTHYRDALDPKDLSDPRLLAEGRTALDELTQLLGLGSIYPFQL